MYFNMADITKTGSGLVRTISQVDELSTKQLADEVNNAKGRWADFFQYYLISCPQKKEEIKDLLNQDCEVYKLLFPNITPSSLQPQ